MTANANADTETADDPFATLQEKVQRENAEQQAARALSEARALLVIGKDAKAAFFATLAMNLEPRPCWAVDTACTDGKRLWYNPAWFGGLAREQQIAVLCHEVMHPAHKHHARRGDRDPEQWNIAADLAINGLLRDAGYHLPPQGCFPGEGPFAKLPRGLCAEEYYNRLPPRKPGSQRGHNPGQGQGQGGGEGGGGGPPNADPGGCGGVCEPGDASPAACHEAEADWDVKVLQAGEAAKRRGTLPASIQRLLGDIQQPKVNWRDVLREFVSQYAKNDYSWSPPNRRHVHRGLYLPGVRSEELGRIVLAVDTSGSIGLAELNRFASEAQGILDAYDCELTILYHDAAVAGVQTWRASDGPLVLTPVGGGGTDHRPVFDHIDREQLDPTCLVCLTDMCSCFPAAGPEYPVLWCSTAAGVKAPFGQLLKIGD